MATFEVPPTVAGPSYKVTGFIYRKLWLDIKKHINLKIF